MRTEENKNKNSQSQSDIEECQLPECDNSRIRGAHYCSPEHEFKAASQDIRVTAPPSKVYSEADRDA